MNVHLMIVDPQYDFMDYPESALRVPGANDDMRRLTAMIDRVGSRLEAIHVTMDTHRPIDIAHPGMWVDSDGHAPAPFTVITHDDVKAGRWRPRMPSLQEWVVHYTERLEADRIALAELRNLAPAAEAARVEQLCGRVPSRQFPVVVASESLRIVG